MRTFWLASYPKSGNTWMRILLANLAAGRGDGIDINKLGGGFATARAPFDRLTLIDSGLLDGDEVDALRPQVHRALAGDLGNDEYGPTDAPARFVKVHDAYHRTANGEPVLGGRAAAAGALIIVRDPRDVAPSLAHHSRFDIDRTITFMNDDDACFCDEIDRGHQQLRQKLTSWSDHVGSWLSQRDLPVHLLRYEDLQRAPVASLRAVLDFAGWPATDDAIERALTLSTFDRLAALERDKGFREAPHRLGFFRRGKVGAWRDELSAAQVACIEEHHGSMMQRLGYPLAGQTPFAEAG
jgi:hypothetical protein